jgi:hypothetical protein
VSAPAPPIVLRWTPEPADLQESVAAGRWARGGAARHKVAITAGVMVAAALTCVLLGQAWVAPIFVVALLPAVFNKPLNRWAIWRALPSARQPTEMAVLPDALVGTTWGATNARTTWQWSSFAAAVETPRLFVLIPEAFKGRNAMIISYLPKRALAHPAEADRLRQLLVSVLPGGVRAR